MMFLFVICIVLCFAAAFAALAGAPVSVTIGLLVAAAMIGLLQVIILSLRLDSCQNVFR